MDLQSLLKKLKSGLDQTVSSIPGKVGGALNQQFNAIPQVQGARMIANTVGNYANRGVQTGNFSVLPKSNAPGLGSQAYNLAADTINFLPQQAGMMASEVGKIAGQASMGQPITPYHQIQSPAVRLGYQLGNIAPVKAPQLPNIPQGGTEYLGNAAGAALVPLSAYGGGALPNFAKQAIATGGRAGLTTAIKVGATQGAKLGGAFGALEGLSQGRGEDFGKQLALAIVNGAGGAALGGALGGGIAGAGGAIGMAMGIVRGKIKVGLGVSDDQAEALAKNFLRDELGRFAGSKKNTQEPQYYGDLRQSLGLPRDGNYQQGYVRLPGKSSNKVEPKGQKLPEQAPSAIDSIVPTQSGKVEALPPQQLPSGELPNGQQPPSSSQSIDPVQKIINALQGAKPVRGEQEAIYAKIRSQQAGALSGIGKRMGGEAGFYQKLGQMKGEMPKVSFESIRKEFTQTELDSLFNKIEASPLSPFEKLTAQGGFRKLLGAEGGVIPNKSELALLNEIFPPEFTQALLDKRPLIQKLFSLGEAALNLPRAMMATADLSAPLRQGVFLIGRPKQWLPASKEMFKYALSEKAYVGLNEQIKSRPTYPLMREAKLAITDMSPVLQNREEMFMSNLTEKIPVFGRLASGSNRAYSGFLNKLRADTFDDLVKSARNTGLEVDGKLLSDIGNFVNTATGRGGLGALQGAATVLNGAFFSPRLMASRLNLLNPIYYVKLDPFVRKEALKSLLTFAGTAGTVFGLAKLGGLEVGVDPRSADFAKIKSGDTRYDILGGFQQYIVLGARLLSGEMVSSTTGKEMQLGEGYNTPTRTDIIANFLKNKQSPVLSFITSLATGKDALGQKINVPAEIVDMFIPMLAQSIADLQKEEPGLGGIAMGVPSIFGVGVQTYTDPIPMEGRTPTGRPNVTWRQQPSLGEDILNRVTGTQLSTIPQDQWAPLAEARKNEQLWKIKLDGIKKAVLTTGEAQVVQNPITGASINVFLDNGVVKTKDMTPKPEKSPKTKVTTTKRSKAKSSKAKITIKTNPKIKIKLPKATSLKALAIKPIKLKKLASLGNKKVNVKIKKPKKVTLKTTA